MTPTERMAVALFQIKGMIDDCAAEPTTAQAAALLDALWAILQTDGVATAVTNTIENSKAARVCLGIDDDLVDN